MDSVTAGIAVNLVGLFVVIVVLLPVLRDVKQINEENLIIKKALKEVVVGLIEMDMCPCAGCRARRALEVKK